MNIPTYPLVFSKKVLARVIQSRRFPAPVAEVDNGFLKERFGLADYSLHSVEAITT